ncbi:putative splicing factor, arginine/serine-rich 7 [Folsomia candida]|uniref:Putative splicing factor, arginine/serine-rich 7 n=1 Tax=Folsomia candida TaxID=158441 RepID=A0A226ERW8_FOLCA|nr:putative splicing factor, arginine/serine-rich 7 [Folsomia candida]
MTTTGDSDSPASSEGDSNDMNNSPPPAGGPSSTWGQHLGGAENGSSGHASPVATPLSSIAMLGFGVGGRPSAKRVEVDTHLIQVANIAPASTKEQMQSLFGYIGKIDDLRLYPTMDIGTQHTSKICFVKFRDTTCVGVAQHLTNTVFVDRALIVIPYSEGEAPDEAKGLELLNSGSVLPGVADPKLPQHVTSQLEGIPPHQVVVTSDPKLAELQLPPYPNLPPTYDSRRIEEIRRTIMIANIDPEITGHDLLELFGNAGEIKYLRMCTRDNDPILYALVEFTEQPSVLSALQCNGTLMGTKHIKVYHSTQAIVKPQAKTNEAAQKEIEEAMTRQAQNLITQGLDNNGNVIPKRNDEVPVLLVVVILVVVSDHQQEGQDLELEVRVGDPDQEQERGADPEPGVEAHVDLVEAAEVGVADEFFAALGVTERSSSKDRADKRREKEKKSKRDKDKDKDKEKEKRSKDVERESKDKGKENGVKLLEEPPKEEAVRERDRDRGDRHKDRDRKKEKRKSHSKSPSRDKRRSTSREKRKRSKSKKKKRGDDREDSVENNRTSNSPNNSLDKESLAMDVD